MLNIRDIAIGLRKLEIDPARPIIAHASLASFGEVMGGAQVVIGALLTAFQSVIMPTFTYKTMITPEIGPENNAMVYGSGRDINRMAEFFQPDMPADVMMGTIPETLRRQNKAKRSAHPILSFAGINAEAALNAQTIEEPLAPVRHITEAGGWVVLLGVGNSVNTSIHFGEKLAGRKQFTRWALTTEGVIACPGFPGCSDGFDALDSRLEEITRRAQIGNAVVRAFPLVELTKIVQQTVSADPLAFLCSRPDCERCSAVRAVSALQP